MRFHRDKIHIAMLCSHAILGYLHRKRYIICFTGPRGTQRCTHVVFQRKKKHDHCHYPSGSCSRGCRKIIGQKAVKRVSEQIIEGFQAIAAILVSAGIHAKVLLLSGGHRSVSLLIGLFESVSYEPTFSDVQAQTNINECSASSRHWGYYESLGL